MAMRSSNLMDVSYTYNFGPDNTPRKIAGTVKKLGSNYQNATVAVFRKSDLQLVALRKPDSNGNYSINGLNKDVVCFVVAFDSAKKYNAVIQDMVVPK
ncbi:hypothetical protein I2F62_05630 [Acinetobacter sp. MD2(2019)]|nr:hypothetical protein [Acinetobacter sp. MD2(2019)]